MSAQADNPDGFWEHLGFVELNKELLNALGSAGHLPPKLRRTLSTDEPNRLRPKRFVLRP